MDRWFLQLSVSDEAEVALSASFGDRSLPDLTHVLFEPYDGNDLAKAAAGKIPSRLSLSGSKRRLPW